MKALLFSFLLFTIFQSNLYSQNLIDGYNDLFAGSGECALCHNSQVSPEGYSVAIAADWSSTMMANASRDPLWRAKVSAEVAANPIHKNFIEDKCSKCHAPAGNVNFHHTVGENYLISTLESDPFGQDGVQCTVCHQISPSSLGMNSAEFQIGLDKRIYGPYLTVFPGPMINFTGYTPLYSSHIDDSGLCGTCHTLLTHPVSPEGEVYENEFVEQSIYQEWKNSVYPDENQSCQSCHIPRIQGPIVISNTPPWLNGQEFFGQHHFVGANILMNNIFQDNMSELGIPATSDQLKRTKYRTSSMLETRSAGLELIELSRDDKKLQVSVEIKNLAGHKLPSGFPSRRVFVELLGVDATGDTIFHSGKIKPDYRIVGEDQGFELHHEKIDREDQVQIYEIVMGDINNEATTELLRAHKQIKDNRIPPVGFSNSHLSYDTVKIAGKAVDDIDFNFNNGVQGSGSDLIKYDIPISPNSGQVEVFANIYYQTISPKWLDDVFSKETKEADMFKEMYEKSGSPPVLIASETFISRSTSFSMIEKGYGFAHYPNPVENLLNIEFEEEAAALIQLYSVNGQLIESYSKENNNKLFQLDVRGNKSGIYMIHVLQGNQSETKKVFFK